MNKESTGHDFVGRRSAGGRRRLAGLGARVGLIAAAGASLFTLLTGGPQAQQRYKEPPVKVTSVTTSGGVVSISADGSLNRAQTWQDDEGFHVVLVNGQADAGSVRGARVQRVGNSLELVVPVRRGANVTVQPRGNRLDLVVSGGSGGALRVENFPVERRDASRESSPQQESQGEATAYAPGRAQTQPRADSKRRAAAEQAAAAAALAQPAPQPHATQPAAPPQPAQTAPAAPDAGALGPAPVPAPADPVVAQPAAAATDAASGLDLLSLVLSVPSLVVLVLIGLAGAAVMVVRRKRGGAAESGPEPAAKAAGAAGVAADEKTGKPFEQAKGDRRQADVAVPFDRRNTGRGAEDEATRRGRELAGEGAAASHERAADSKHHAAAPAVVFGSYRIDQEVASLVRGGPHSTEVLASRAADDRRAVETSLLKALRAPETDEDGRRRARTALEDYGFVARSCAGLLLGSETFERVSAARALGDMKSAQALPFLTEALYDGDAVVRAECVQSLGALGMPSAIGALLDVARRHQDIPASVLGPALTACSVESLEVSWDAPAAGRGFAELAGSASPAGAGSESRMIVPAAERYEELPDSVEDEALAAALVRIESTDAESRVNAAQQLAQYQVRRAVAALAAAACADEESAVRSAAVTSLGLINHESVFGAVIVALADEAREVRAAAARALSRLSFDRADGYVRLVETADAGTLQEVARACVKAGLAAQAVSRLTSEDRRQAYEAFSLLSLCVSGGEAQPVLDAVETHQNIDARLTCIQLLGDSQSAEVCEQLARLAGATSVPERVRQSIHETVERAARPAPVEVG